MFGLSSLGFSFVRVVVCWELSCVGNYLVLALSCACVVLC